MHVAWWVVVLIVAAVLIIAVFTYRRRRLVILRGAIEMSVHRGSGLRGGWVLGVASYTDEQLNWYRMSSLRAGPSLVIERRNTEITDRREPTDAEASWMPPDPIVLGLRSGGQTHIVAVPKTALPGLLSWWESAPPVWSS